MHNIQRSLKPILLILDLPSKQLTILYQIIEWHNINYIISKLYATVTIHTALSRSTASGQAINATVHQEFVMLCGVQITTNLSWRRNIPKTCLHLGLLAISAINKQGKMSFRGKIPSCLACRKCQRNKANTVISWGEDRRLFRMTFLSLCLFPLHR